MTKFFSTFMILLSAVSYSAANASETVALYDDKGVWRPSLRHLRKYLRNEGIPFIRVSSKDIQHGVLRRERFKALVVPGGKSWEYLESLGELGASEIRSFVRSGGGYLGICAGAFLALSHREGGRVTGPYGISLLQGTSRDLFQLNVPGFHDGVKQIRIRTEKGDEQRSMIFLEGPSFRFDPSLFASLQGEVHAWYSQGEPAAISFNHGQGRVVLIGPHPELNINRSPWMYFWYRNADTNWDLIKTWTKDLKLGRDF